MTDRQPIRQPPRVSHLEWVLALLSLSVALLGYASDSYEDLAVLAPALLALSVALVIVAGFRAVRSGVVGKLFLALSTLIYFWLEAYALSRGTPPFGVQAGLLSQLGEQFSIGLIQKALVYVALFQLMLLVGYSFRPRLFSIRSWVASRTDTVTARGWVIRTGLLGCAWLPLILSFGGIGTAIDVLSASRSEYVADARDTGLISYLPYFGLFAAALLLAEGLALRSKNRLLAIGLGTLAAIPYILIGARHLWLFVGLPAVVLVLTPHVREVVGRGASRRVFQFLLFGLAVLLVVQLQFILRNEGWDKIGSVKFKDLGQTDTTGQFTALLYAEHLVPREHGYFLEPPEASFVTHWVPRRWWPDKPVMRSVSYYDDSYTQGQTFNVTPSIIGQFHINYGVFGVALIGLWLGFLTCLADRLLLGLDLDRQKTMAVVIGMAYAFIVSSFRFYSPYYFTYLLFAIIGMLLLTVRSKPSQAGVLETRLASHSPIGS